MGKCNFSAHCSRLAAVIGELRRLLGETRCAPSPGWREEGLERIPPGDERRGGKSKDGEGAGTKIKVSRAGAGQGIINWLLCVAVIGGPNCERPSIHFLDLTVSRLVSARLFPASPVFVPSPACFSRRAVNGPETLLGTVIFGRAGKSRRGVRDGWQFRIGSPVGRANRRRFVAAVLFLTALQRRRR